MSTTGYAYALSFFAKIQLRSILELCHEKISIYYDQRKTLSLPIQPQERSR
ncbi:hypothetical protein PI95_012375 [Hassallia byssoidea VB512170]|uniref:Uncharacterized protein n=1 Tax=Hassallia byssoidea VB512170 TaxID=1304833 RepID=A0A846HA57_9CYAN|nr:hypothetical protein [Hassalia byssoidea]NEU73341.1 hypothetical protein [Hassalia byssoidea VB512170]